MNCQCGTWNNSRSFYHHYNMEKVIKYVGHGMESGLSMPPQHSKVLSINIEMYKNRKGKNYWKLRKNIFTFHTKTNDCSGFPRPTWKLCPNSESSFNGLKDRQVAILLRLFGQGEILTWRQLTKGKKWLLPIKWQPLVVSKNCIKKGPTIFWWGIFHILWKYLSDASLSIYCIFEFWLN